MQKLLKKYKYLIIALLLLLVVILAPDIVYAATSSKLKFCEYGGTRRMFKIIGMAISIIKILVPVILIITGVITLSKTIISGKEDDLKGSFVIFAKKIVAGLIIFAIPSVLDYTFDTLVGYDDSSFTACSKCMLNPNSCQIPDEDPDTYTD